MQSDPGTSTRDSLIEAGLHLFGRNGYEGTSTRDLAGRAGTNIASITYHFGGKAGLRDACIARVATRVGDVMGDDAALTGADGGPDSAGARIEGLVTRFVGLIVGTPEAQDMVAFMLREITTPGDIPDTIYATMVEPRHRAMCQLWATATGRDAEDPEIKLAVFALIGQVLYFRVASSFVRRRLDWATVGPEETARITRVILASLRDTLERLKT